MFFSAGKDGRSRAGILIEITSKAANKTIFVNRAMEKYSFGYKIINKIIIFVICTEK